MPSFTVKDKRQELLNYRIVHMIQAPIFALSMVHIIGYTDNKLGFNVQLFNRCTSTAR